MSVTDFIANGTPITIVVTFTTIGGLEQFPGIGGIVTSEGDLLAYLQQYLPMDGLSVSLPNSLFNGGNEQAIITGTVNDDVALGFIYGQVLTAVSQYNNAHWITLNAPTIQVAYTNQIPVGQVAGAPTQDPLLNTFKGIKTSFTTVGVLVVVAIVAYAVYNAKRTVV